MQISEPTATNPATLLYYRAYGLTFASEIPLPELSSAPAGPADVFIRFGSVPLQLQETTGKRLLYEVNRTECLMHFSSVCGARFLVRDAREIVIDMESAADPGTVRLFLLGTCISSLLYQRNCIPIHANTVQTGDGAVIIAGASGAGKSTISATLMQRGYPLVADDVSCIRLDEENSASVTKGVLRLKLWRDSVDRLGFASDSLNRVRPELEKYSVPAEIVSTRETLPLRTVYLIEPAHDAPVLTAYAGLDKLTALRGQLRFENLLPGLPKDAVMFHMLSLLAARVRVVHVRRTTRLNDLPLLVNLIESDFQ